MILMTEDAWRDSYFSIVRHTGRVRINGSDFYLVDKDGFTVFEKSIPPGEPADLIDIEYLPLYQKYGRERFIECLRANPYIGTVSALRKALKARNVK
jgi:hypothetical protein